MTAAFIGVLPISSLSLATLAGLPPGVLRPGYDPAQVRAGIIHLGLGAFHRAHQAVYTNAVLARDPGLKVHLYGKDVRPGRKVGHVTVYGDDVDALLVRAHHAADYLTGVIDE